MVVKQDNNGDTFLICEADPSWLFDDPSEDEVTPGPIGRHRPAPATCGWTSPHPTRPLSSPIPLSPPSNQQRSP
jgi:hypothetical protein